MAFEAGNFKIGLLEFIDILGIVTREIRII
jgi:hypothetical protein